MTSKRVLISAYGCEPGKGSEQGVGWNWCLQMARFAEIVVITRCNNQLSIEAAMPAELTGKIRFEYYDLPRNIQRFKRQEKGLYWYYLLWQWGAYQRARQLCQSEHYDYAMHLTFGSVWMPTFVHRLPLPFIWGPVGGGEAVPLRLIGALPVRNKVVQYLRYALMVTFPLNPFAMNIIRRSRVILARTSDTAMLFPGRHASKVKVILETAVADDLIFHPLEVARKRVEDSMRVIYTGRLIALKNVASAIHAIARARTQGANLHLVIVGDGPLRSSLSELVIELGIAEHVEFLGAVSQEEVIQELCNSDIYLFPSLKEGGAWSLMEAMSVGLPVVCVESSGMAVITDDNSAIRIKPVSQEFIIDGFTRALVTLWRSPEHRQKLGECARARISKNFRWHNKGVFMQALLEELECTAE